MAKNAFRKCSAIMADYLDVSKLHPQLNSKGLLTEEDNEKLLSVSLTRTQKIQHLLDVLPRKGDKFLDDFMYCLGTTTNGTGHAYIAKALSASYNEDRKATSVGMASDCTSANKLKVHMCVFACLSM